MTSMVTLFYIVIKSIEVMRYNAAHEPLFGDINKKVQHRIIDDSLPIPDKIRVVSLNDGNHNYQKSAKNSKKEQKSPYWIIVDGLIYQLQNGSPKGISGIPKHAENLEKI